MYWCTRAFHFQNFACKIYKAVLYCKCDRKSQRSIARDLCDK
nr:MAG TPA: hypothetical protein [Caudoviricetes sp.]